MGRWEDGGWDDRSDGSDDGYAGLEDGKMGWMVVMLVVVYRFREQWYSCIEREGEVG